MAFTHGMNVEQVKNLANQLRGESGNIGGVIDKIDKILGELEQNWAGKDLIEFKGWWTDQHRPALNGLKEKIEGLGKAADFNADRQADVTNQAV
jgi:uncharacterized protein YukE